MCRNNSMNKKSVYGNWMDTSRRFKIFRLEFSKLLLHTNLQLEKELRKLQENQMTEKKYKEEIFKAQADILKLENQLDVVNKKCGDVMAKNASLREIIDHILLERYNVEIKLIYTSNSILLSIRANFNEMWQKIVLKLEQGKKYIVELIDQSTVSIISD